MRAYEPVATSFDRHQYKVVRLAYNLMGNLIEEHTTHNRDHLTEIVRFEKLNRGTRIAKWIVVKHMLLGMNHSYGQLHPGVLTIDDVCDISTGCQLAVLLGYRIGKQSKKKDIDIDQLLGYAHGFVELSNSIEEMN
tara:strand:+ start:350 stop:757 length:408 start_codon:yes stop_codon:yes gene_type:complete